MLNVYRQTGLILT